MRNKKINKKIGKMNRNVLGLMTIIFLIIFLSFFVSAVSMGFRDEPLKIYPGETRTTYFSLGNEGGDAEWSVKTTIIRGSDIASLSEEEYTVPAGEVIAIPMKVSISSGVSIGTNYVITLDVKQVSKVEGPGVMFGNGFEKSLEVNVVQKPAGAEEQIPVKEAEINIWWYVLAVIVILLIVWWFLKSKKKSSSNTAAVKMKK